MTRAFSVALVIFCSVALRATTLSSNLGETVSSTEFVGDETWIASSFATDSSAYLLSNAVLSLSGTSNATANLYLYSNSNGQPGLSLGQLPQTSSLATSLALISFSGNNLGLAANSIYWLVLQAPTGDVEWGWTGSSSGTGVGFQHAWGATDDGGGSWFTSAEEPMIFSAMADPVTAAVPEPSNVLLLGTALVLFCSRFLLRRETVSAALVFFGLLTSAGFSQQLHPEKIHYYKPLVVNPPRAVALTGDDMHRCPDATRPCFKDNKDFLNGQRQLLRTDDLVFEGVFPSKEYTVATGAALTTANSGVQSAYPEDNGSAIARYGGDVGINIIGGRLYNTPGDVLLKSFTYTDLGEPSTFEVDLFMSSLQDLPVSTYTRSMSSPWSGSFPPHRLSAIKADFNGDSFDDILYFVDDVVQTLMVATAVDVNDASKGIQFGPDYPALPSQKIFASGLAAGRFRGKLEVAVLGQPQTGGVVQSGLVLTLLSIDPKTLAITVTGSQTLPVSPGAIASASLAAGHFNATDHDQVAVVYSQGATEYLFGIDFDSQGNIVIKPQLQVGAYPGNVLIHSGKFDWQGQFDQLSLMFWSGNPVEGFALGVIGFDDQMNVVGANKGKADLTNQCVLDMKVGNFDHTQPDPTNPSKTIRNPNMQIAVATAPNGCGPGGVETAIWNVTGNQQSGWTLTPTGNNITVSIYDRYGNPATSVEGFSLATADTQGRSVVLGDPTIVVIDGKEQPSVILAAPPMHVDYVVPIGKSNYEVLNATAAPGGFYTSYQTSDTSKTAKSTTNTTSWSFAAQETLSTNYTLGNCELGDCASFDTKTSAKQALDGSTAALDGTFANDSVSISDATGFADSVWYSQSTLTIYIYPVIGKKVCPANSPNCADKDKVQETVQFAGPDTISAPTADGLQVEWYQPPWMPGNILSYPGNLQQLQAASFTDPTSFQSLTDPREWFTDTSDSTAQATWTVGSKDGSTSSFNQNYSFETDLSFTLKAGLDDIASASAGVSLDLSGSYGLSNLTNSTTSLSKSTGIGFTKKATFANPGEYGYWVTPYIFGQKQPGGVVDNKPLSTDVQTFGILQTGHVVDPLASGAGAFWTSWYTNGIDIGLNQPWRWSVMATATNPGDGSCLIFDNASSDVDCATPGIKTPGNPATDEFHWMRGLFITKASASGNSAGPQIGNATAGDQLLLRARVYNFSFQPMPANSSVHVRFYGTPWNRQENSAAGPSFLIGEQIASSSIPPFNTDTPYPNWILVGQPFDTTPHANQDLVFWVVVWAQDEGGKLIADLPHHGLTSIPAATADYAEVAAVEENYGNNLGFYKQVFHVSANQSSVTQSNAPGGVEVPAEIILAGSERNQIRQGEPILISAKLRVGSAEVAHGIHVDFYDGEPGGTRKLIGSERLPYLRASMIYKTGVIFRSGDAGVHRIFIVAGKGTTLEQEVELRSIVVTRAE